MKDWILQVKATLKIHSRFRGKLERKVKSALAAAMSRGVPRAVELLGRAAESKLHRTAQTYKRLLAGAVTSTEDSLTIEMTGALEGLEKGYPPRDMKPALLASANAKTSEDGGRYVDVPFRHGLTGNSRFQGMPTEIKDRVQAVVRNERSKAAAQGRDERNPLRVTGKLPATNSKHATSIHSNMIRTAYSVGKSNRASYETVRRVSSKSDSQSWRHPGFAGVHALRQAKTQILTVVREFFQKEMLRRGLKAK